MAPLQSQKKSTISDQLQIQHFTHQHLLQKLFTASEFNCNGCLTRGQGIRYRCSACDFDLHEQCASYPHYLSSNLHPHHQLILVSRSGNSHFCNVCKGFTDGLSYTCQVCGGFDVHPLCAQPQIPSSATLNPSQQQGGVTWGQPFMMNQQQHLQGMSPTTPLGGYQGVNIGQQPVMMMNQQQQMNNRQQPTTRFGGYNNSHPVMMMNQQQQTSFGVGGYHGVNNDSQLVMVNQQQHLGMGTTAFGIGGYPGVNNNQPMNMMMMNQLQLQQQQQQAPGRSNSLSKVGKLAANVLMTSLIGVPINFNSRN